MCATVHLAIHLSKDIWANFSFRLLEAKLLQTSMYVDLTKGEQMCKVLKNQIRLLLLLLLLSIWLKQRQTLKHRGSGWFKPDITATNGSLLAS